MRSNERGAALILVLWFCIAVAVLAAAFVATIRLEARRQFNQTRMTEARALLDIGFAQARLALLDADAEKRWQADGRAYRVTIEGGELTIRSWFEAGKLDINTAPEPLLRQIMGRRPEAAAMADHILQRRTSQPYVSILELAAPGLPGRHLVPLWLPLLTVHGSEGESKVSAFLAPEALLRRWPDLRPDHVRAVLQARTQGTALLESVSVQLLNLGLSTEGGGLATNVTIRVDLVTNHQARLSAEAVMHLPSTLSIGGTTSHNGILEWREPALSSVDLDQTTLDKP